MHVVLIEVNNQKYDIRPYLEMMESSKVTIKSILDKEPTAHVLSMSEFMDAWNNDELPVKVKRSYIGYVEIVDEVPCENFLS
jgi:hypothetical protein